MEIRALRSSDDRSTFRSDDPDLDRFFHRYAGQNQFRHHIGTTYVAVEQDGSIVGYATVAPGHIEIDDLPPSRRRKLPSYPLPILRLARLSVDVSAKGQGVGREILRFVLNLARKMALEYGCIGVVVDAKLAAVGFYERFGFFRLAVLEGQSEGRPAPAVMFLPIGEIEAAARGLKA
jgi:GNAT superfamily N-acetyltransferase